MKIWAVSIAVMGMFFLACGGSSSGGEKADSDGTTTATDGGATTATDEGSTTATDEGSTTATDEGSTTATDGATDDGTTTDGTTTDGTTTDGTTNGDTTGGLPTTDGGTTDGGTTTDGGGTTGGDSVCYDLAGIDCITCLTQEDVVGAQAYITALVQNCICANECQASCTASCGNPQAQEPSCQTCLDGLAQTSACTKAFSAECAPNVNCLNFSNALIACPE